MEMAINVSTDQETLVPIFPNEIFSTILAFSVENGNLRTLQLLSRQICHNASAIAGIQYPYLYNEISINRKTHQTCIIPMHDIKIRRTAASLGKYYAVLWWRGRKCIWSYQEKSNNDVYTTEVHMVPDTRGMIGSERNYFIINCTKIMCYFMPERIRDWLYCYVDYNFNNPRSFDNFDINEDYLARDDIRIHDVWVETLAQLKIMERV